MENLLDIVENFKSSQMKIRWVSSKNHLLRLQEEEEKNALNF